MDAVNRFIANPPENHIFSLKCKAVACKTIEIISYVALVAIMTTVFALSYSGIVLSGTASGLAVGMVLSTIGIGIGVGPLGRLAKQYSGQLEVENGVLEQKKKIENWKEIEIEEFIRGEGLVVKDMPHVPLCKLLPAIARFKHFKETAEKVKTLAEQNFADAAKEKNPIIQRQMRQCGWNLQQAAIPAALDAAIMLRIIQQPFNRGLELLQPNGEIPLVGRCYPKTFEKHGYDTAWTPNDDYVVFEQDLRRAPLTRTEIWENMDPKILRSKLFDSSKL